MATTHQQTTSKRAQLHQQQALAAAKERRNRRLFRAAMALLSVFIVGIVAFGLWSARPDANATARQAPEFSLRTTAGTTVSLADYRGKPVILYFNEGAGCGSCTQQMALIEKEPGFAEAGITVLPIVMNTAEQIQPDLDTFGVTTPYLLDDGQVSKAYDTLDKGMHPGLPGHGFVLIDANGRQVWSGNYPSMFLEPKQLLQEATSRL
ncbi:MAG: peroxiredoxin family protein [Propionibacteriaceae bacterium]|nr:peroxiredoxin family protein [Propionibacteriaceae bacterium]